MQLLDDMLCLKTIAFKGTVLKICGCFGFYLAAHAASLKISQCHYPCFVTAHCFKQKSTTAPTATPGSFSQMTFEQVEQVVHMEHAIQTGDFSVSYIGKMQFCKFDKQRESVIRVCVLN